MANTVILKTEEQIKAEMMAAATKTTPLSNVSLGSSTPVTSGPTVMRLGPSIGIQNLSTVLTDSQVQAAVAALQIQLDRDFFAGWGFSASLQFLTKTQPVPLNVWPIYVLDNTDTAGALGYHDESNKGVPYGRIFAKTCMQYGYSWTVTLSHELLEMMANPNINLTVFNQSSNTAGTIYFHEIGDPCEDDSFGYTINGILVSDFVWPAWFDPTQTAAGTRYDQGGHCTAPFQVLHNGYVSIFNVSRGSGWTTITRDNVEVPNGSDASGRNRMDR